MTDSSEPQYGGGTTQNRGRVEPHYPSRAALCAVIPGIGAVYNRQYIKAVVHFSIFAALIILSSEMGIFGLAAFAFYIFTIMDAYRSAEVIGRTRDLDQNATASEEEINFPLWGGILIFLGVLFLLDSLGAIYLRSILQFWPLIFILLGIYLILQASQKKQAGSVPPAPVREAGPAEKEDREEFNG